MRLTNLDEVLFPVDEQPVFASVVREGRERRVPIPGRKALVNRRSGRVLGVVGRDYRVVTNREALALARECCRTVFPETQACEWEAKGVDAPSTGGDCRIDLLHNSTALDFSFVSPNHRPEAFGPFIRVTNSYNGLRALGFDIGYYRKVCRNGLILPGSFIRFRFPHTSVACGSRRAVPQFQPAQAILDGPDSAGDEMPEEGTAVGDDALPAIRFYVAREQLARFNGLFTDGLARLRGFAVPARHFPPLLRRVLMIRPPLRLEGDSREANEWAALISQVKEVCGRYASELGENAYALFNAITDVASHPPSNGCLHRDRHTLQQLAGAWLAGFNEACRKPGFSVITQVRHFAEARSRAERSRAASWESATRGVAV